MSERSCGLAKQILCQRQRSEDVSYTIRCFNKCHPNARTELAIFGTSPITGTTANNYNGSNTYTLPLVLTMMKSDLTVGITVGGTVNQHGEIQDQLPWTESQITTMAGVPLLLLHLRMKTRMHTLIRMTIKEWIMSPVMGNNHIPRTNPKEKGNINPLTSMASVEEIPMKMWEGMCAKERNGTVMVRL